jgi:glucosamine--fructose-6-phosphate aminotransferase (isomerizing)
MCGIIGYVGGRKVVPLLINGLKRLEYRGYDSAGIAIVGENEVKIRRCAGKIKFLEELTKVEPIEGTYGLGHTRWATHGRPNEENAHPHRDCTGDIVIVHNGILDDYVPIKNELSRSHRIATETDSELIAHLIEENYDGDFLVAVQKTVRKLKGLFAFAAVHAKHPDVIIAARSGPPLIVGIGKDEYFVASDIPALLDFTRDVMYLSNERIAVITRKGVQILTFDNEIVSEPIQKVTWEPIMAQKAGFKHYMLKEIYEQPWAIRETITGRLSLENREIYLGVDKLQDDYFNSVQRIYIVACGTSWHAAIVGKFMIESLAKCPAEVIYSSEFRYATPIIDQNVLTIFISQSGETADTLAAVRLAKQFNGKNFAICNVVGSSITNECDATLYTHAGPEIGVAATKTFTSQLVALFLFALYLGKVKNCLTDEQVFSLLSDLIKLPGIIEETLKEDDNIASLAKNLYTYEHFLFLSRGINYPIALEGALKLKEISYIHAEGYPAGEMKHGPIALIDNKVPSIFIAPQNNVYDKIINNMYEVKARDGRIIAIVNRGDTRIKEITNEIIEVPHANVFLTPIVCSIPVQLFAYHMAVKRGADVDQPRNLAKSVTVE